MTRKTATRAGLAVLLAWTATALLAAAAADSTTGAAAAAEAKPKWLLIPGFWPGTGTEVVGSAAGRAWIGFEKENVNSRSTLLLGSLRSVGGRLSFAKKTLDAGMPMMIVGSQLVYHVP